MISGKDLRGMLMMLLLTAAYNGYAQPKNDSVFSTRMLAEIKLADASGSVQPFLLTKATARKPTVIVFLSPECPLCQNYTVLLDRLAKQYGGSVSFYGIIPGKTYDWPTITAFAKKYKTNFPLLVDGALQLSKYLNAAVTPEVVLLDENDELVYRGALDNWLTGLGKRRAQATENFLQDAIDRHLRHLPATPKRTKPVGCTINDY